MQALTARELDCLRWVALGKTSWETGTIMGLTERTVNFHMARVCDKLGVCRRQAAVAVALQTGLLPLQPHMPGAVEPTRLAMQTTASGHTPGGSTG